VRWVLDQGVDVVGWSPRAPDELELVEAVSGWSLTDEHLAEIDRILDATIEEALPPDFLAPAVREAE
jgi:aryl-alcohol dehydrogenase-like predicted oxidoreductase